MANFKLHGKEIKDSKEFIEQHKKCKPFKNSVALFSYILTPNGIGIGVKIRCPFCNEEKDITDVSCW